jgi:probable HAF family extracellular repeat protein
VGLSDIDQDGPMHAFLWENGVMKDLGTMGGTESWSNAINSKGQVVGTAGRVPQGLRGRNDRAFLWEKGIMRDLDTLGGAQAYGGDINDAGWVVGSAENERGKRRAFLDDGTGMRDLGVLGQGFSQATSLNASGRVVGYALPDNYSSTWLWRAFLYAGGIIKDLNEYLPSDSGWVLRLANSINDRGQIVGEGTFSGYRRAFLLTPTPLLAPSNLTASSPGASDFRLSWQDNSSNEAAFEIWRKSSAGEFARIAVTQSDITTFTDTHLHAGTGYTYRVRATNPATDSPWSNEVSVGGPSHARSRRSTAPSPP